MRQSVVTGPVLLQQARRLPRRRRIARGGDRDVVAGGGDLRPSAVGRGGVAGQGRVGDGGRQVGEVERDVGGSPRGRFRRKVEGEDLEAVRNQVGDAQFHVVDRHPDGLRGAADGGGGRLDT